MRVPEWIVGTAEPGDTGLHIARIIVAAILTAIVVGISTTALGLALIVRIFEAYGTIEEDETQRLDIDG